MKFNSVLEKLANGIIRVFLALVVTGLLLQSIFSTSFMGKICREDGSQIIRPLYVSDSPLKHIVVFLLFLGVLFGIGRVYEGIKKKRPVDVSRNEKSENLLNCCIVTFLLGLFFILTVQLRPGSDPAKVYTIALQWREGDFSSFTEGGYLFRYPFQSGIVLFYYILSFLLGKDNYLGLQLINVLCVMGIYYFISIIAGRMGREDTNCTKMVYTSMLCWFPFLLYTTYLYGILPGMLCSVISLWAMLQYLEERRIIDIIIAVVTMSIAMVLKTNSLIYVVAMICYLVYDILVADWKNWKEKLLWKTQLKSLIFIVLLCFGIVGAGKLQEKCVENLAGYELTDGEAKISWVVMGLQDSIAGPGSYSGYIGDVFTQNNYNTVKIKEASRTEILKLLKRMAQYPLDEGIPFFARKTAYQWNDPTFTAMWLNNSRISGVIMPDYMQSILNGKIGAGLTWILNYVQSLIYAGVLLFLLLSRKRAGVRDLSLGVVFLGGFFFHMFWQASSSYTIPYFLLLIPYATIGYKLFAEAANKCSEEGMTVQSLLGNASKEIKNHRAKIIIIGLLLLLFIGFSQTNHFEQTIALHDGDEARAQYLSYEEKNTPSNGYYNVKPFESPKERLAVVEEDVCLIGIDDAIESPYVQYDMSKNDGKNVWIVLESNDTKVRFRGSERILAIDHEDGKVIGYMDDTMNMFYESGRQISSVWKIVPYEENTYYLLCDNLALTYDTEGVHTEEFDGSDSQKWVIE